MEIKAYAKLNFFLDVVGIRSDGYHDIISIMQTVDWYDIIKISKNVSRETVLKTDSTRLSCGEENIAYRAAQKYLAATSITDGLEIEIQKNIPIAAGMAGGSADAAAVLLGLNEMFEKQLTDGELLKLGAELGADIPFCMKGGTGLVSGIGDKILPCEDFPDCTILCAKFGEGVSTPIAYRLLDEKNNFFHKVTSHRENLNIIFDGIKNQNPFDASKGFFNVFEDTISALNPDVSKLKRIMTENGSYLCQMSGSGPSVFGLFHNEAEAGKALYQVLQIGAAAKICHPVNKIRK